MIFELFIETFEKLYNQNFNYTKENYHIILKIYIKYSIKL